MRSAYISFVVTGRNDSYGGLFLERLRAFIDHVSDGCVDGEIEFEIIIVEWNPPNDRPHLKDVLNSEGENLSGRIRILSVRPELLLHSLGLPEHTFLEYFAKNVGIRRASGQFILSTNPDVIFSPEFFDLIRNRSFSHEFFYRIDRVDYRSATHYRNWQSELLVARDSAFKINRRHSSMDDDPFSYISSYWSAHGQDFSGPLENEPGVLNQSWFAATSTETETFGLHINASGDFLLASKEAWHAMAGYPEITASAMHIDACGVAIMKALGLQQAIFVPPILMFHREHDRSEQSRRPSWTWMNAQNRIQEALNGGLKNHPEWGCASPDVSITEELLF